MNWKDFLYFQRGERVAVTLLLAMIFLAILLNITICSRSISDVALLKNDSIREQFDVFRELLQEREEPVVQRETELPTPRSTPATTQRTVAERRVAEPRPIIERTVFPRVEKLSEGETIMLNATDTIEWMKIPGIGSTFANRIVRYQSRLGGFSSVSQLLEVHGIDDELFARIMPYIAHDDNIRKLQVNRLEFRELLSHPYLEYTQVQIIMNLRRRTGNISSIEQLAMLSEFSDEDIERLRPYLEF